MTATDHDLRMIFAKGGGPYSPVVPALRAVYEAGVAAERERAAKIAEQRAAEYTTDIEAYDAYERGWMRSASLIAAAIREGE